MNLKPKLLTSGVGFITFAALLGVAVTVALGLWQLSRAAGKEALQAAIEVQRQLPPLDGAALLAEATLRASPRAAEGPLVGAVHVIYYFL